MLINPNNLSRTRNGVIDRLSDSKSEREEIERLLDRWRRVDVEYLEAENVGEVDDIVAKFRDLALRLLERAEKAEANQHEPFVCVNAEIHLDVMRQKDNIIEWIKAEARDCGCSDRILAKIAEEAATIPPSDEDRFWQD